MRFIFHIFHKVFDIHKLVDSGNYNLREDSVVFEKIPGFIPIKFDVVGSLRGSFKTTI